MKLNFLFIVIIVLSCTAKQNDESSKPLASSDTGADKFLLPPSENKNTAILETFTDSMHIGEKEKCKIELIKHSVLDDIYVIVKFYTRGPEYWQLQNVYLYECDALMGLNPEIVDFNNDLFNDLTFVSSTAARGANEVRRLFVYDDSGMKLVSIVNSQDFPNMLYNRELDCIDAYLVHGGRTTVFARIERDSLVEFARVNVDEFRTVYETDKFGNEKLLSREPVKYGEDIGARYINYKPLKEYKE